MSGEFHRLRVLETTAETKAATRRMLCGCRRRSASRSAGALASISPCAFGLTAFEARPLVLHLRVAGHRNPLRITVKRVADGLVSNYINEHLAAGDVIDVMPPFGGFYLAPEPQGRRTYYFFGAGSGITPLYAMIRTIPRRPNRTPLHASSTATPTTEPSSFARRWPS